MAFKLRWNLPPTLRAMLDSRRGVALSLTLAAGLAAVILIPMFGNSRKGSAHSAKLAKHSIEPSPLYMDASQAEAQNPAHRFSERGNTPAKLVRKGSLNLEVSDLMVLEREAHVLASAHGVMSQWQVQQDEQQRSRVSFTLTVRPERFDMALSALRRLGRVVQESSSTEDITRAYADLEARQANKRVAAKRLRELIETRAGTMSDVIEAEEALAKVTEELERMAAQQRVMDQELAFSWVHVEASRKIPPPVQPSVWSPLTEAMATARSRMVSGVGDVIILLASIVPWIGLPALGMAMWFMFRRRRESAA